MPVEDPPEFDPIAQLRSARVTVWFWGTGGAGIRLADRFAVALSDLLPPEHVTVFGHIDNELLHLAAERGNSVVTIAGAAGHARIGGLAALALPRAVRFWRHLRHRRPDAIIIPMNFALAWPLVLMARLLRIPYAYMVHDAAPHPGDFAPLWQTTTQRRLVADARCIISPSAFTTEAIGKRLSPKAPVYILPLAALTPMRRTEPRGAPGLPVRFLFLGRLLPYKGLGLLADALRPLVNNPDWRLTIAGTGPEADRVRGQFAGFSQVDLSQMRALPEEAIESLISAHDVLICPYTEASQSGVIAEAGADAMPCLVTPVGALPEQIWDGRSGWIAKGTGPEELCEAIEAILDQPDEIVEKSKGSVEFASRRLSSGPLNTILIHLVGP